MKNLQKFRFLFQLGAFLAVLIFLSQYFSSILLLSLGLCVIGGSFFCGWLCPFGTIQEFSSHIGNALKIKKISVPKLLHYPLSCIRYILFGVTSVFSINIIFDLIKNDPQSGTLLLLQGKSIGTAVIVTIVIFAAASLFIERFFCRYLCIQGAKNGFYSLLRPFTIKRNSTSCVSCKKCNKVCPMNIDVAKCHQMHNPQCINCFKCINSCPKENTLKYGFRTFSLKQWNRYAVLIALVLGLLGTSVALDYFKLNTYISEKINTEIEEGGHHDEEPYTPPATTMPEVPKVDSSSSLYTDGVYTGQGEGFKGPIDVEVTIENGAISSVQVTQTQDDRKWFNRANATIPGAVISSQSGNVDVVSGATYSSQGIIEGVKDALSKAKKEASSTPPAPTIPQEPKVDSSTSLYTDGVYTGQGNGFKGPMDVEVIIENDLISSVAVTKHRDDRKWFNRANATIPDAVISSQSGNVDVVSGATYSSQGIIEGVKDALSKAKK